MSGSMHKKSGGVRPIRGAVFACTLLAGLFAWAVPAAAFSETYGFAGLKLGIEPEEASQLLEAQGFAVGGPVSGARREFVEQNAWGAFEPMDRGKRIIARGLVAGQRVSIDLVFGYNDRLERIIIGTPDWDGTRDGARQLTGLAGTLTEELEQRYGRSYDKRTPFGFVDTARWMPAQDGSRMELYVRGTNGYMFFPNDVTALRVHIWNDRFKIAAPATAIAGAGQPPGAQARRDGSAMRNARRVAAPAR